MLKRLQVFAVIVGLLACTLPLRAAIAVVSSRADFGTLTSVTTTAIDTSGAKLIVVAFASASGAPTNLTDSASNSWTSLSGYGGGPGVRMKYVVNPSTSASHTFSTSDFAASLCVIAFSGTGTYNSQESGNSTGSGTTVQPGSLTPSVDNTLLVTSFTTNNNSGSPDASINSSFTNQANAAANAGNNVGCAIAYKVQTSASAENPTWSEGTSAALATGMAVFTSAAGLRAVPAILSKQQPILPIWSLTRDQGVVDHHARW